MWDGIKKAAEAVIELVAAILELIKGGQGT